MQDNLLVDPVFAVVQGKETQLSLPGVLAALTRDEVEDFPALRPHQAALWHMFLVQLGGLALVKAGQNALPQSEAEWAALLRGLTPDFTNDEPWRLVVDDWTKPAFLQPPVPADVKLANEAATPDALDLLITSKNHDLKQAIAREGRAEDWVFALVSLQTGEGYGGAGNNGIVRMNGGSSSRAMLSLAPLTSTGPDGRGMIVRPGAWFARDLRMLLTTRDAVLAKTDLYGSNGLGLTWAAPWPEGDQLQMRGLDIWFIEVCRRVRLTRRNGRLTAFKGTSKANRINGKELKGNVEDPWAPFHTKEGKSFTLGDEGDFDFRTLSNLLFGGEWETPLLATLSPFETSASHLAIVAQALARGNSKTGGFRSRLVPIESRNVMLIRSKETPLKLRQAATTQMSIIKNFSDALAYALVLAAASGDRSKITRELYPLAQAARDELNRFADDIFFDWLWRLFDATLQSSDDSQKITDAFAEALWRRTQEIFERFLPTMPLPSLLLYRLRAETQAWGALRGLAYKAYPNPGGTPTNTNADDEMEDPDG